MSDSLTELKSMFKQGDLLTKLIFINCAAYLAVAMLGLIAYLCKLGFSPNDFLALPAAFSNAIGKPWTLLTYMFTHNHFFHFIFNMLMLYWMGKIFLYFNQARDIVNLYILGGIAGGLTFIAAYSLFPVLNYQAGYTVLVGASASILAILAAAATQQPEMPIKLTLLGEIKMKWIAIAVIAMGVLSDYATNPGGCISHLGGAVCGFFYAKELRKGKNIAAWVGQCIDSVVNLVARTRGNAKGNAKFKVVYDRDKDGKRNTVDEDYNMRKKNANDEIDAILDKIKISGYGSLTKEEKEKLFNAGK